MLLAHAANATLATSATIIPFTEYIFTPDILMFETGESVL